MSGTAGQTALLAPAFKCWLSLPQTKLDQSLKDGQTGHFDGFIQLRSSCIGEDLFQQHYSLGFNNVT